MFHIQQEPSYDAWLSHIYKYNKKTKGSGSDKKIGKAIFCLSQLILNRLINNHDN